MSRRSRAMCDRWMRQRLADLMDLHRNHGVALETVMRMAWLWGREQGKRVAAKSTPAPSIISQLIPRHDSLEHDMLVGPCKCGAWHERSEK